ncbi:MAG TPA: fumarylacetoacetate hydrolase family protein [Candidatus Binatia bacterium]|nr:fumarylacetoacetate hydrolase family protein [Candidatus Binatia bacterium]
MKFCRYNDNKLGVVEGENVHDVSYALEAIPPARWPFPRGDQFVVHLEAIVKAVKSKGLGSPAGRVADVILRNPVPNAPKIVAAPVNYQLHIKESIADTGISMGRAPLAIGDAGLFLKSPTSLIGPDETINVRFPDRRTDHELELGVIIGKTCSDVSRNDALDYVAGYAIALDMTVRGKEDRSFRKSIDGYSVLGPWLVTADEIPNPDALDLEIKVNGQTKQKSNTKNLIYDIRKLVEWGSQWYTLYPGDIIMTGTPEGVSPVQPGDVLECSIERIGSMTIRVGAHRSAVASRA